MVILLRDLINLFVAQAASLGPGFSFYGGTDRSAGCAASSSTADGGTADMASGYGSESAAGGDARLALQPQSGQWRGLKVRSVGRRRLVLASIEPDVA